LIFLVFFTVNFILVVYSWQEYYIDSEKMEELLRQIATIYSVQFSVILAGIFAMRGPRDGRPPSHIFAVALLLVLAWNINVTWPLAYLFIKAGPQKMDIDWHLGYWKTVPELTSFLCTAALTFFFVRREQESVDSSGQKEAKTRSSSGPDGSD